MCHICWNILWSTLLWVSAPSRGICELSGSGEAQEVAFPTQRCFISRWAVWVQQCYAHLASPWYMV